MGEVAVSPAEVGNKLVELCKQGKFQDVIEQHYADDIVSVEAVEMPGMGREMKGIEAIKGKNQWWAENHEVHGLEVNGPYPHDDRFAVRFKIDATPKMTGKRQVMDEVGLYTVKDGKIVREEFFYPGE